MQELIERALEDAEIYRDAVLICRRYGLDPRHYLERCAFYNQRALNLRNGVSRIVKEWK